MNARWLPYGKFTAVAVVAAVGAYLLLSAHAATASVSMESEKGTISSPAVVVSDSTASGASAVKFAAGTGGGGSGIPTFGSYVMPGSVGYLGSTAALTIYQPGGDALPGCSWQSYGMRCDTDNLTIDHAWFKGALYWNGTGTLTVTNSLWEGGNSAGTMWGDIQVHNTSAQHIIVKDSTLRWNAAYAFNSSAGDIASIWSASDADMDLERNDLSGFPQGIDPPGNSTILKNYFHDIRDINGNHRDGIFSQGGNNILIQQNYVDGPAGSNVTAALFFQSSDPMTGIKVYANYLAAGPYYNLHNEDAVGLDFQNNTFGTSYGAVNSSPGTIGKWLNNKFSDGSTVPQP